MSEHKGEYIETIKYSHNDGIKETEHQIIVKISDEGNTIAYHGSGGDRNNPHATKHKDGKWYDRWDGYNNK